MDSIPPAPVIGTGTPAGPGIRACPPKPIGTPFIPWCARPLSETPFNIWLPAGRVFPSGPTPFGAFIRLLWAVLLALEKRPLAWAAPLDELLWPGVPGVCEPLCARAPDLGTCIFLATSWSRTSNVLTST